MSDTATVMYDAPGPKARALNRIITLGFAALVIALAAWVIWTLAANEQLTSEKWSPFLHLDTWTTYILPGLLGTVSAAALSIVFALVLGAVLGIGRLSEHRGVRWISGALVEFFRAIPVLILMIFAYYLYGQQAIFPSQYLAFTAVVTGLTLYNGSVIAEILRSGIESLPRGQSEAAVALGLRKSQMMRLILLPQSIAAMLPALISQMVIALKDSALGYAFGYIEVVRSGIRSASYYGNYLPALVVVAVIMIAINFALSSLATKIERQLREGRKKKSLIEVPHAQPEPGSATKDLRQDHGE
ncbi:amino acid ABC transporter permease [Mycobacterium sp. CBMA271]|uniref:amino acid ABC transporter permease n=1 Tax=unclassified Mycobacteroides TaxID=2618759 RepID=UPI0012DBD26E|nr:MULTISPECIES: amino acid ABC transporter permease [unclassified Mycobacteroides]MUM17258.1 glutamate ABC transporter permease [Mycobacteroides sp. CBMA 326]MUM23910.1 amino acid ABC transporter permease [Mycobacteroides sp. CBMA 271]